MKVLSQEITETTQSFTLIGATEQERERFEDWNYGTVKAEAVDGKLIVTMTRKQVRTKNAGKKEQG